MGAGASAKRQKDYAVSSSAAAVSGDGAPTSLRDDSCKAMPRSPRVAEDMAEMKEAQSSPSLVSQGRETIPQSPVKARVSEDGPGLLLLHSERGECKENQLRDDVDSSDISRQIDRYAELYRDELQNRDDLSFVGAPYADKVARGDIQGQEEEEEEEEESTEQMMRMYRAALLAEAENEAYGMGYGRGGRSVNHRDADDGYAGYHRRGDEVEGDEEYEANDEEEEEYYARRYRYGINSGADYEDEEDDEGADEDPEGGGAVDDEHLESLALSAMSLGMDNEELLFNLYYFGQQGASEDPGANVRSSVNTAIEEAVAAHSANNTPYKLRPVAKDLIDSYITSNFIKSDIDPAEECLICQENLLSSPRRQDASTSCCGNSHGCSDSDKEVVQLVACKHFFHRGCVTKWFTLQNWCPICRSSISAEPGKPSAVAARKQSPNAVALEANIDAEDKGFRSRRPSTDSTPDAPACQEVGAMARLG